MQKKLFLQISDYLARKRRHRLWVKVVGCLACIVVFGTIYALILPAITMEKEPLPELTCTYESLKIHTHTKKCYDKNKNLICGYADFVVHTHDEGCYDEDGNLVCSLPEMEAHTHSYECYEPGKAAVISKGHTHTENCYTKKKGKLLCGQEESEGHTHSEACYTKEQGELLCNQEESEGHTHEEDCYDEEGNTICGQEESEGHTHEAICYASEERLSCGQEESEGHTHTDECYEWEKVLTCKKEEQEEQLEELKPVLVCGLEECEAHTHTEKCYQETEVLICKQKESKEHTHTDDCYKTENQRICNREETEGHEHTDDCYMLGAVLTCEKKEIILHTHSEECYNEEKQLICGKLEVTEHIHGDDCFVTVKEEEEDKGEEEKGEQAKEEQENTQKKENNSNEESTEGTERHLEVDAGFATITAAYKDGILPEGAALEVVEYDKDSDTYNMLGQEISYSLKDGRTLGSIYPYDIHFVDADGKEVEPEGTVAIAVTYEEPIQEIGDNPSQWAVFHKTDTGMSQLSTDGDTSNGTIEELTESSVDCDEAEDGSRSVTGFVFETDSFSDFVLAELNGIETLEAGEYSPVAEFEFWMWAWNGSSNENTTEGGRMIADALQYTENDETYYLIPIRYFTEHYAEYGYTFDEKNPGKCPVVYAPDASYPDANLTSASYVQAEGGWYVRVQDKGTYGAPPPRSNIYYRNYNVVENKEAHSGTVINLFDYWLTEKDAADYEQTFNNENFTKGINAGHALKFSSNRSGASARNTDGAWNVWTGSENVYDGIVNKKLIDSYPALSGDSRVFRPELNTLNNVENDVNLKESLAYLFDPSAENPYKETYRNVGGLLQTDSEGYYYYNSQENFAEYNEDTNKFILYDERGVLTGGSSPNGQFFPFNSMQEVAGVASTNARMNHYFGMTLTTRFIHRYNGYTTMSHTMPTTFEFAGDDDVWIFIDDVLVADLGGIHNRASVKIDFSTGEVKINGVVTNTLKSAFQSALGEGESLDDKDWNNNTFANNTMHTMKFYYLERGNTDSNLYLKYNLSEIPSTSIYKVNQYGDDVEGAVFAVYATNENWEYLLDKTDADDKDIYIDLSEHQYTINPENGQITITEGSYKDKTISQRYIGTTNSAGEMIFVDEDKMPYSLEDLQKRFGGTHFILREVAVPEGYRLVSDEIRLYVANKVLLCDNTYDSGVWAASKLLVTATDKIYPYKDLSTPITYHKPETNKTTGTLFAVVFKYIGDSLTKDGISASDKLKQEENWAPIYGSDMKGYTVVKKDSLIDAVIEAAKQAKQYGDVVFTQSANGSMQLQMNNLPGSILNYYYMLDDAQKSQTQYTVSYYWTSGDLSEANADNTFRINADAGTGPDMIEGAYDFDRAFGATVEVPNLTNRLFVQKLDEDGNTLVNDAVFALYKVEESTKEEIQYIADDGSMVSLSDKKYTVNAETGVITIEIEGEDRTITPVMKEKTLSALIKNKDGTTVSNPNNPSGEDGTATFTNMLEGKYYLREISAPDGYELNETEIMVLVDDEAIYANAGTKDDDVTVARGPGYVVSTMEQFASEGEVDNSLSWVYERLLVSEETNRSSFDDVYTAFDEAGRPGEGWSYLKANYDDELTKREEDSLTVHLEYNIKDEANTLFNYTLNDKWYENNEGRSTEGITRRLYTPVGWSYYLLYQDYDYGINAVAEGANYNDLRGYGDISNLFSRSTYVQVTNRHKAGNLEISKKVVNAPKTNEEETTPRFTFTVDLSDADHHPLTDKYTYTIYDITSDGNRTEAADTEGNKITGFIGYTTDNEGKPISNNEITLTDGQVAVIENLPAGTQYTVTETRKDGYATTAIRDNGKKQTTNAAAGEEHYEYGAGAPLIVNGTLYWNIDQDGKFDGTSTVDYTNTYLPDLSILKYKTGDLAIALSGAKFLLYYTDKTEEEDETDAVSTNYYYSYDESSKTTSWEKTATEEEAKQKYLLTSNDNGTITLHKIPDGTYHLQEVEAPAGYNRMTEDITFTVSGGKITQCTPNHTVEASDDGLTLKVPNSAGYELPHTGGPGTYFYRCSGLLLLAGTFIYGCRRRHKHERRPGR